MATNPENAQLQTLLAASIVADSLAMPAHWIYDPAQIPAKLGRVTDLVAAPEGGYHAAQPAGGQTHYGDQALALMDALGGARAWDADAWGRRWFAMWEGYGGYVDGATRTTRANHAAGKPLLDSPSPSDDLGGASRIAALVVALRDADDATLAQAAMASTRLTHGDPVVLEAAAFLARAARGVLEGRGVAGAIEAASHAAYDFLPAAAWVARAQDAPRGATAAVQALGAACPVGQSLPAALAIALQHAGDLEGALVENVMAGGDSAARGLAIGMLLGGEAGAAVPARWLDAWRARPRWEAFCRAQGVARAG